jgi:tetratricopeptide (TPR) repeat protein
VSYFNLAQHYQELGDLEEARRLAERALEIREKNFGTEDVQLGEVLNQLGLIALLQKDYAQAEAWLTRGIEVVEAGTRAGHPSLSIYHGNLAQTYLAQAKLDEAERHYRAALDIVRMNEGPRSLLMARAEKNLAEVLMFAGKRDEAEALYLDAISIYESLGPEAEGELGLTLNNLAIAYRATRRYGEAEAAYLRAQQLLERQPQVTDYAASQFNLARLYIELSRYDDAEPLLVRSLAIYGRVLGPDHTNTRLVRGVYADLLRKTDRADEAERLTAPALPPGNAD